VNKERTISGIKVVVSGETYNEYKGTLQEQLEEKDKEIERLNNIIKEVREYIKSKENKTPHYYEFKSDILEILDKGE
jgi:peptidoglycan hydrolase CwlO-like protein